MPISAVMCLARLIPICNHGLGGATKFRHGISIVKSCEGEFCRVGVTIDGICRGVNFFPNTRNVPSVSHLRSSRGDHGVRLPCDGIGRLGMAARRRCL